MSKRRRRTSTALSSPVFSWVRMSSTPGTARASSRSSAVIRPLAIALVTRKAKAGLLDRQVGRVARLAGHLEPRVEARGGLAHVRLREPVLRRWPSRFSIVRSPCAAACRSARTSVRLPSSILKALCSRPRASAKAASAAAVDGLRRRAACRAAPLRPSLARHGTVATPPSAMRASRTVPPSRSSATAADASANS